MYPGSWFVWNPYRARTHAHAILPVIRAMQLHNVGTRKRRRRSIHYFCVAKCLPLVTSCLNFSFLYKLPCGTEWIILELHTSLPQLLHTGVMQWSCPCPKDKERREKETKKKYTNNYQGGHKFTPKHNGTQNKYTISFLVTFIFDSINSLSFNSSYNVMLTNWNVLGIRWSMDFVSSIHLCMATYSCAGSSSWLFSSGN